MAKLLLPSIQAKQNYIVYNVFRFIYTTVVSVDVTLTMRPRNSQPSEYSHEAITYYNLYHKKCLFEKPTNKVNDYSISKPVIIITYSLPKYFKRMPRFLQ